MSEFEPQEPIPDSVSFTILIPERGQELRDKQAEYRDASGEDKSARRIELNTIHDEALLVLTSVRHRIKAILSERLPEDQYKQQISDLINAVNEEFVNIIKYSEDTRVECVVSPENHVTLTTHEIKVFYADILNKFTHKDDDKDKQFANLISGNPREYGYGSDLMEDTTQQIMLDERGSITFAQFQPICDQNEAKIISHALDGTITVFDKNGTKLTDIQPEELHLPELTYESVTA